MVGLERPAGARQVRVDRDVPVACAPEVVFDAGTLRRRRPTGPRCPCTARTVRALREPAPGRRATEQPLVLRPPREELQADALVAGKERKEAVRRGGTHQFYAPIGLEAPERADQV